MHRFFPGSRQLGMLITSLTLSILPYYSPLAILPAANAAAAGAAASTTSKRAPTQTLHDAITTIDDARSLTVTDPTLGALKVTLSKRGRILKAGKTAALIDFHVGDTIAIRGHLLQAGQFTATSISDQASQSLASTTHRAPVMKISAIDATTGEVTLQSTAGSVRIIVLPARLRMTRKKLGAVSGLTVGQTYGIRLGTGPDGEPDVSLSNATGPTPRTRKPRAAASVAPVGGAGTH